MNENINLIEILKDAPKGMKLWSPVYGDCTFMNIDLIDVIYPVNCQVSTKNGKSTYIGFTIDGRIDINYENSGCVLFPSKENRDWSTFKVPKKHKEFKQFDKVLVKAYSEPSPNHKIWFPDIYLFFEEQNCCHRVAINKYIHNDDNIIPYEGNEDKLGKTVE